MLVDEEVVTAPSETTESNWVSSNSVYIIFLVVAGIVAISIIVAIVMRMSAAKKKRRPKLNWGDLPSPLSPTSGEVDSSRRTTLNRYYGTEQNNVFSDL